MNRLGCKKGGGIEELKNHIFFAGIDWEALLHGKIEPPFKPKVQNKSDVGQIDEDFL